MPIILVKLKAWVSQAGLTIELQGGFSMGSIKDFQGNYLRKKSIFSSQFLPMALEIF
ncbi:MAG: hypothetical protein CM15mP88_3110 [Pseudomonadota bacterium]|nr:MAG: hypothetical protein CM15mP88_3110 [Pseudomonadota bacterium]